MLPHGEVSQLGYIPPQGSGASAYLPVLGALFGHSHGIIQPHDTTGLLQIFHAASESRCRNIEPEEGFKRGGDGAWQAHLRTAAGTLVLWFQLTLTQGLPLLWLSVPLDFL